MESLRPSPACVVSRTNDLLAANRPGLRLFAGITDWPPERRNLTLHMFLHPMGRRLYRDGEKTAGHSAAHLRAMAGTDPDMPELAQLVGELAAKSLKFARRWERYEVRVRSGGQKHFNHPEVGSMRLHYGADVRAYGRAGQPDRALGPAEGRAARPGRMAPRDGSGTAAEPVSAPRRR
ncbi:hypothetical protein [Streptomyces sp. 769]|uniref:MmyB family transcriptional regulator n=1 Tax=Streptomyces sp. 769 TaxID=1262452 RepID=UPI001EF04524|nr:hypothetical protein [Streptomyces sp. 769]